MKDIIAKSFLAGTTAFLYKNILNHIVHTLGLTTFLYREAASDLILPLAKVSTFYGIVLGLFIDWIALVWVALLLAYILRTTGSDYYLIKGGFIGASTWLLIYCFLIYTGILGVHQPNDYISGITSLFFDVTMGLVSSYVLVYLSEKAELH